MKIRVGQSIPRGKSRDQIAREVGISRVHLQRIIAGQQTPSVEIALKLSAVLGLPVETLFQLDAKPKSLRGKAKRREGV